MKQLLAERLEEHANELIERLLDIARNGGDADALRAIEAMLNRVYGRPTETVEVHETETERELKAMTPEERKALLRRLEAKHGGSLLRVVDAAEG